MDRLSYGPYLYALSPDVLAVLTMHGESIATQRLTALSLIVNVLGIYLHQCVRTLCFCKCIPTWLISLSNLGHPIHCVQVPVGAAGVLGSMLSDDEAGRVKLTRLAMSVGKVSPTVHALQSCTLKQPVCLL